MTTLTAVASLDGDMSRNSGTSWADARSGAGSTSNSTSVTFSCESLVSKAYITTRALLAFDTSSIPDAATIQSATLGLTFYGGAHDETDYVVSTTNTTVSTAGYAVANWGSSAYGSIGTGRQVNTKYSLSLTGYTVNKTGTSYLGMRGQHDLQAWTSNPTTRGLWHSNNSTTVSYRPELVVVYSEGGSTAPLHLLKTSFIPSFL